MDSNISETTGLLDEWHGRWGRDRFYVGLLLVTLSLGLVFFLLPGLPEGDDLYFHLYRIEQLSQGLRRGEFRLPIYREANCGYGYSVNLFYSPLFVYPVAVLRAVGMPLILSVKIYLSLLFLLTGWGCYACTRRITASSFSGFVAGILCCLSSYYATDLSNRFALGEIFAFVFVPWAILGYYEIVFGAEGRWEYATLGFGGLLLSHNLSFFMAIYLFGILALIQWRRWKAEPYRLIWLTKAGVLALVMTSCFWLPMAEQFLTQHLAIMDVTNVNIGRRAMPLARMFLAFPDMHYTDDIHIWAPPGMGMAFMLLLAWRLVTVLKGRRRWQSCDWLLAMGVFSCFMASVLAPWGILLKYTPLSSIQFPWRFLLFGTCFLAIGGGAFLGEMTEGDWKRERRWILGLLAWCGCIWIMNVASQYWFNSERPMRVHEALKLEYLEGFLHYAPSGVTVDFIRNRGNLVSCDGGIVSATAERDERGNLSCRFTGGNGRLELPLIYYRGYRTWLAGSMIPLEVGRSAQGLVEVVIPEGVKQGQVVVRYVGTALQLLSGLLSLGGMFALTVCWLRHRRDDGRK